MTSVRCRSLIGRSALFCAALALSVCSAGAQNATSSEFSSSTNASTESSSNAVQLSEDTGMPVLNALPAAPDPKGGAGQYDNKSRGGGGGGGIMSHMTWELGGGFNAPTSDSAPYITWGGNFTVGAGYRWNQNLTLNLEFQFIDSKLPGAMIAQAGSQGGHDHIFSLTLDPMYEFNPKSAIGFYAVGGYGFYHKSTIFTDPQTVQYCYFYCGYGTQNVTVGQFSTNQGGWSIGGGLEHRFAGWNGDGKTRVFAEARYLDVLSPAVVASPNGLSVTTVGADTKIIPVTFGVRF